MTLAPAPRFRPLSGKRILVAEDLYLLADALAQALTDAGAISVGPFPSRAEASACLAHEHIDAAVLDIGLNDGYVFPVAAELRARGIPFLFLTGYDAAIIPDEFAGAPWVLKPAAMHHVCELIWRLLKKRSAALADGDPGRT